MLKMRKILSVALVVVMLFSVFAVNAFALEDGKEFGMILVSDKTEKEIVRCYCNSNTFIRNG